MPAWARCVLADSEGLETVSSGLSVPVSRILILRPSADVTAQARSLQVLGGHGPEPCRAEGGGRPRRYPSSVLSGAAAAALLLSEALSEVFSPELVFAERQLASGIISCRLKGSDV